jgi:UrcA family protein
MIHKLAAPLIAALFLSAAGAPPALAADSASEPMLNRVVRFGDLDLSTDAGVTTLSRRISTAAWKVCGVIAPPTNGPSSIENMKCRQTLTDEAVAQVNSPALTARFAKKGRQVTASR